MGTGDLSDEVEVALRTDADIVVARELGRTVAVLAGSSVTDVTVVATAISEIARNAVVHGGGGVMTMRVVQRGRRYGIEVMATDDGPGIEDVQLALQDGYTTGGGLGLGLPGARRLMDELHVTSQPGRGTSVVMRKWAGGELP